jgi:phospholipid/cholesterol/gamma-HCH transport system substrate-binding protein
MKLEASQKAKTGLLVLVGILLLLLAIFFIGSQKNLFSNTFYVQVKYKNVSGLMVGNFVRFTGINVGTVQDIAIVNDSTVNVTLAIQKSVHKFIKTDAVASIGSDGLMGDKIIQVVHGSDSSAVIAENGYLKGSDPVEMSAIMNKFTAIADNAAVLTDGLAKIVTKVNGGEGSLGRLLNSDQLARSLEGTMASTQATVATIKKGAEGFKDNMEAAKSNFLLKGFFKRKEKKRIADSLAAAKAKTAPLPKKKG